MNRAQPLPLRPRPVEGEDLIGFLSRALRANGLRPFSVLQHLMRGKGKRRWLGNAEISGALVSPLLLPFGVQPVRELIPTLGDGEALTLAGPTQAIGLLTDDLARRHTAQTLIARHRRACPLCYREQPYTQLLHQVQEVRGCLRHGVLLLDCCERCGQRLPLLPATGGQLVCSGCGHDNASAATPSWNPTTLDRRIDRDWGTLARRQQEGAPPLLHGLGGGRAVAIRLVWWALDCPQELPEVRQPPAAIAQGFRYWLEIGRGSRPALLSVTTMLAACRHLGVEVAAFLDEAPSRSFVDSVQRDRASVRVAHVRCSAPWCRGPGRLRRTDWSPEGHIVACQDCGTRYLLKAGGVLEDRDGLFAFAFAAVCPQLETGLGLAAIARTLQAKPCMVRQAIEFLVVNGLVSDRVRARWLPASWRAGDPDRLIAALRRTGRSIRRAGKALGWPNGRFRYTGQHVAVRAYLAQYRPRGPLSGSAQRRCSPKRCLASTRTPSADVG